MPLEFEVQDLESVPEALRDFYEESDGTYKLAVQGVDKGVSREDFDTVKSALTKANNEAASRRKALEKWDALGLSPEDAQALLDAEEERRQKDAEKKGEWDKLAAQMTDKHAKALAAKDEVIAGYKGKLDKTLRENAARSALEAADAYVHAALPHVLGKTAMREIDGDLRAVVLNDAGEPRVDDNGKFMTIEALVKEMSAQEEWGMLFKPQGATGGGSNGRGGARGASRKAFNDMSEEERVELLAELEEKHGQEEALRMYGQLVRSKAA